MHDKQTYSVPDFCKAFGISRSFFYLLKKKGLGPVMMRVGRRRMIDRESAMIWVKQMQENI